MSSGKEKILKGKVVSNKMQKSIVVRVDYSQKHKTFHKTVRLSKKVMAHDESEKAGIGDVVIIKETLPLSKRKRYQLVDVVEKATIV